MLEDYDADGAISARVALRPGTPAPPAKGNAAGLASAALAAALLLVLLVAARTGSSL